MMIKNICCQNYSKSWWFAKDFGLLFIYLFSLQNSLDLCLAAGIFSVHVFQVDGIKDDENESDESASYGADDGHHGESGKVGYDEKHQDLCHGVEVEAQPPLVEHQNGAEKAHQAQYKVHGGDFLGMYGRCLEGFHGGLEHLGSERIILHIPHHGRIGIDLHIAVHKVCGKQFHDSADHSPAAANEGKYADYG